MKGKLLFLVVAMILFSLLLTGCQALAQGEEMNLEDFLLGMMTGPGIGLALSVILEYFPFAKRLFDKIEDLEWKRMTVLVACIILPTLALLVAWQIGYTTIDEITVWVVLAAAWEAFTTSTLLHGFIRQKPEPQYKGT